MKFGGTFFQTQLLSRLSQKGCRLVSPAILQCKFIINEQTRSSFVLKTKDSIVSFVTNLRNKNQKQWIGYLNKV